MATPLIVLTNNDVQRILGNLNKAEVERVQLSLRNALHEYSTGNQDQPACQMNQQDRLVIQNDNKTTTLVMPARSSVGVSMKVVTLAAPQTGEEYKTQAGLTERDNSSPQGSLTLMDNDGVPFAFIDAEELTAFRTALSSSLLMVPRKRVKNVFVFGVGKQAFWHLRLALLFHGHTIEHVHIHHYKLGEASKRFFQTFVMHDATVKKEEGWHRTKFTLLSPSYAEYTRLFKQQLRSSDIIICATPSVSPLFDESLLTNPNGRIKGRLIIAIGSFRPEMIELPPAILKQAVKHHGHGKHFRKRALEGGCVLVDTTKALRQSGELVQADLHLNHVVEIGEIVMLYEQFAHEFDDDESAIDDIELSTEALPSSGMSSMASALSEINNHSRRSSSRRSSKTSLRSEPDSTTPSWKSTLSFQKRRHDLNDHHTKKHSKDEEEMNEWLCRGNVIYKSVGLGLMDLVVGNEIVRIARDLDYGIMVKDF